MDSEPLPRTFVINLARRADRREHMARTLQAAALPFELLPAVDGRCLVHPNDRRQIAGDSTFAREADAATLACFASHRQAWERVLREGLPHAVLFEDDAVLGEGARALLAELPQAARGLGLVKLDCFHAWRAKIGPPVTVLGDDRALHPLTGAHLGATAYFVECEAAQRLIQHALPSPCPVDHYLFDPAAPGPPGLTAYQLRPAIVTQFDEAVEARDIQPSVLKSDLTRVPYGAPPRGQAQRLRYWAYRPVRAAGRALRRAAWPRLVRELRAPVPFR